MTLNAIWFETNMTKPMLINIKFFERFGKLSHKVVF
jgi:hypothetical protein